ncbi:MAG: lactate racemase domain-containing protein [Ignavibacteriaceae bacterium]
MLYFAKGSEKYAISDDELKEGLISTLEKLGEREKVLALPPDITRFYSRSGDITGYIYQYYNHRLTDILPTTGTHYPMTEKEIGKMYPAVPKSLFRIHKWREDLHTFGDVPSDFINDISEGKLNYSIPAQTNKLLVDGNFDLILSIGQVVPHEVIGMANYNKNIFIGAGGKESIHKSHYLGAVYGMERIMGRVDTPVRQVLNYASENFAKELPIIYILTVIGKDENNKLTLNGLFIGDDFECFRKASELSLKVNFEMLEEPLKKVVVYLEPMEFKSTWLGNKSIYRTRMAIADDGELIVIAPGLKEFGEDKVIDRLIRKYGYVTTPEVLKYVEENDDLKNNLSAAAHLIHGSSENRFKITYCPGHISKKEIESVNFNYASLDEMIKKYNPEKLKDGFNKTPDGEEIFFISNPGLGLWTNKDKFIE